MTKHKHTPGPWWPEGPDEFNDFNILHQGDALAVAAVISNMRELPEIEANAQLISAAPDLLEALEQVSICLSQALTGGQVSAVTAGNALVKAAEAFEKATGEQLA